MLKRNISPGDQLVNLKVIRIFDSPDGISSPTVEVECKCGNTTEMSILRLNGSCPAKYCGNDCKILAEKKKEKGGSLEKANEAKKEKVKKEREIRKADLEKKDQEIEKLKAENESLRQTLYPQLILPLDDIDMKEIKLRVRLPVWARWSWRAANAGMPLLPFLEKYLDNSIRYEDAANALAQEAKRMAG